MWLGREIVVVGLPPLLGNFERSFHGQLDILKMSLLQYLPLNSLLKMWNNLPLDLKRSNSLIIFKNVKLSF